MSRRRKQRMEQIGYGLLLITVGSGIMAYHLTESVLFGWLAACTGLIVGIIITIKRVSR